MLKKGINIITTAILSCTIAFTSLPVQAQEVYPQIDGYENYNGTYYKLGEQGWQICDDFYMNQTEYYLEVGEYFSIPWQVSDNKNTTCGRDHTLTYSNSNPSVCNVTPDGMLTALSTGLSDITIVCGDGLAVVTIKVHVTATKRSKTAKYKSIVKSINNIYKKYGQLGAITGKNYKTAWKEILAIDKKVKNYSQYVDTFYGQDADVKNRNNPAYPNEVGYGQIYYNALESTMQEIVDASFKDCHEYLRGWGDEFVGNHLLCVDIWKLEAVVNNLAGYIETINPYNTQNKDAFQIKWVKPDKKTGELIIKLKKKITEKQMYGSYTIPEYLCPTYSVNEPLAWTALLHANSSEKKMPCVVEINGDGGYKQYQGEYEINQDTIRLKPMDSKSNQKLKTGKYKMLFGPISRDFIEDKPNGNYPYPVALVQNVTIK